MRMRKIFFVLSFIFVVSNFYNIHALTLSDFFGSFETVFIRSSFNSQIEPVTTLDPTVSLPPAPSPEPAPEPTPEPTPVPTPELVPEPTPEPILHSTEEKYIAITFDDGPDAKNTPKLLDILKTYDAKATFFVLGKSAASYPDLLARMTEEGHEIGNHTYSHKNLATLYESAIKNEISSTNDLIAKYSDKRPFLVRPPYGSRNSSVDSAIKELDSVSILWSIDPRDWENKNPDEVSEHIISKATSGDIVILHDIHATSIEAAELVLEELSQQGYTFVTVREHLEMSGELVPGQTYTRRK